METEQFIPAEQRERNPLITVGAWERLRGILQHPDAPAWNFATGDRLLPGDLPAVDVVRRSIREGRRPGDGRPPAAIRAWARAMRRRSPWFADALPKGLNLARDWARVPTMRRADLAARLERIVPRDADLSRLITYETSGVTGHALYVPHHPVTMATNHAFLEFVLERHGVRLSFDETVTACVNLSAHRTTVVFATVFAVWGNAAFAKVNLHPHAWTPAAARRFLADLAPLFLTGDPLGYARLLAWEIPVKPAAMISSAVALDSGLKRRLEDAYGCPVIDTYATTETGVIGYAAPDAPGFTLLPADLYVEIVDADGRPVPEGEPGEISVTGGRNPYLPLLRYRTGDVARLSWSDPPGADPVPRLLDLQARAPVTFRAADGSRVGPVDIGRVIREWIVLQHAFVQHRDGSCTLALRPAPGCPLDPAAIAKRLRALFGKGVRITVRIDERLGDDQPGGKVVPFCSELDPA
ncbi:MAG: AMP-binding protein [Acidobacteria bacterium]|nr:AMP-binding protein [Acidobacteriota bacterium]